MKKCVAGTVIWNIDDTLVLGADVSGNCVICVKV